MPWLPPSRPRPDSLVPPKGMAAWLTAPSLTPTCADVDRSTPVGQTMRRWRAGDASQFFLFSWLASTAILGA